MSITGEEKRKKKKEEISHCQEDHPRCPLFEQDMCTIMWRTYGQNRTMDHERHHIEQQSVNASECTYYPDELLGNGPEKEHRSSSAAKCSLPSDGPRAPHAALPDETSHSTAARKGRHQIMASEFRNESPTEA